MFDFFDYIKKVFGMDERSQQNSSPKEPQMVEENDTYVAQVYSTPIIEEESEIEQTIGLQCNKNAEEVMSEEKTLDDMTSDEMASIQGRQITDEQNEDISEFVIHKVNPTESVSSKLSSNGEMTNDNQVNVSGLLHSLADIIIEYDSYLSKIQDDEVRQAIELFQNRLIESMISNGVEKTKNNSAFDCMEHVAIPFSVVPDGTPIREIKRIGLVIGEKVLLKANVTI